MKSNTVRVGWSLVIAVAALATLATAASAAQKIIEVQVSGESVPLEEAFPVLPEEICGVSGPFGGELLINQLGLTVWEDGHFVFHTTNSVRVADQGGNVIMRDRIAVHEASGTTSLPFSSTISLVSQCTPSSATPGKFYTVHVTLTVGKDGVVRQEHGGVCDLSAYPFC